MAPENNVRDLKKRIDDLERELLKKKLKLKTLKNSQIVLDAILANMPIFIMLVDQDRRVRKANHAMLRFTDLKEEEIVGLCGGEALGCFHHLNDPKGCGHGAGCISCAVRDTVLDTLKTGKSHHHIEASLPLVNGSTQEKLFLVSTVYINTTKKGALVFLEDITDKKQAETKLKQNERFLSAMFHSIQDGICVLDSDLNILRTNHALRQWYPHITEFTGKKCHEVFQDRTTQCNPCPTLRAMKSKKMEVSEIPYHPPGGNSGILELYAFPMLDESKNPTMVIEYVRDITHRKHSEAERENLIKKLEKALSDVKTLGGMLPICSACKRIRDDHGYWNQIETYIRDHSEAEFSHGICPACAKKLYPDFDFKR